MKKSLFYSILIISLCISGCRKSFLDVKDDSTAIRQSYVVDLNTTGDYLNGIYTVLALNFYQGYNIIYPDLAADNIKPVTASSSVLAAHYNWMQVSNTSSGTSNNMNAVWLYGYQIIRSCNFVIDKVTEYRDQNPDKADYFKGQAYGLRAFMHFQLLNVFAQPYNFTADASHDGISFITSSDWTDPLPDRGSVAMGYASIIDDLKTSISLFKSPPTTPADILYLNRNAAKALLARVYLFKGDYTASKNMATEVANNVPLLTVAGGYPSNLFKSSSASTTEVLFQISPSESGKTLPIPDGGSYTGTFSTTFMGRYLNNGTATQFIATTDMAALLKQHAPDVRKVWVKTGAGKDTIVKYPSNIITGFTVPSGSYYQVVIRSSEMFITAAESYAKLNNEDSARFYLNAIRSRANISPVSSSIAGATLLDSIYTERRRELCFEGLRMFDLQRWGKTVNRVDAWSPGSQILSFPNNKAIAPIPQPDVEVSGLKQNAGY